MQWYFPMSPLALAQPYAILAPITYGTGEGDVAKLVPQATDTIGQRLARIRKASGLTQKELAARLGVTQSVVSDYEHDVLRLHGELIVELGEILGVSPNELLGKDAGDRATTARPPGRLVRKLQAIAQLPKRDQEALFRTIEAFLRNAS